MPKAKVVAVGAMSNMANGENEDISTKISEMMTKAIKIN